MMKIVLGAIALTIAVPAAAQDAPAPAPKAEQDKHDCKKCCEEMKEKGGKMDCMEKKDAPKTGESGMQDHMAHSGHSH